MLLLISFMINDMITSTVQVDVEVARRILTYVLDDVATQRADGDEAEDRHPEQASDEEGGSPRAPL